MILITLQKHNRQKGMALILAIGFLAVLSILGAVVLTVSTRDMKASATLEPRNQSFYTADRSVEYAMNRDLIINLPALSSVDLVNDDVISAAGVVSTGVKHKSIIEKESIGILVSGTVTDIGPRTMPPAMAAIHGSDFGANLYHINVETSTTLGGTTHVDASIVRLFKLDDDQIFRTSGGG